MGVSDVLHLSPHYFSALFIDLISIPRGIQLPQMASKPVMLPEPQGVHGNESNLLVCPDVAGQKASNIALSGVPSTINHMPGVERQQRLVAIVEAQAFPEPSKVIGQVPQGYGQVQRAAIDLRAIYEGCQLVELLPLLELAEKH